MMIIDWIRYNRIVQIVVAVVGVVVVIGGVLLINGWRDERYYAIRRSSEIYSSIWSHVYREEPPYQSEILNKQEQARNLAQKWKVPKHW